MKAREGEKKSGEESRRVERYTYFLVCSIIDVKGLHAHEDVHWHHSKGILIIPTEFGNIRGREERWNKDKGGSERGGRRGKEARGE